MLNVNITIGRKLLQINAFRKVSGDSTTPKILVPRNPIGVQSGLFPGDPVAEDKMLYEKRQKNFTGPRMIVEQVAETNNGAILLPGMNREKVFRPLWVTVPQKDLPAKTQLSMSIRTLKSFADIRKFLSVFVTWCTLAESVLSEKLESVQRVVSVFFQLPSLGFQPALFDATPLASMEKARYIAGRESFSDGSGLKLKFPAFRFVVTAPVKKTENPLRPRSEASNKQEADFNRHKTMSMGQEGYQMKTIQAATGGIRFTYPYLFGALAVTAGIFLNFFILQY